MAVRPQNGGAAAEKKLGHFGLLKDSSHLSMRQRFLHRVLVIYVDC